MSFRAQREILISEVGYPLGEIRSLPAVEMTAYTQNNRSTWVLLIPVLAISCDRGFEPPSGTFIQFTTDKNHVLRRK